MCGRMLWLISLTSTPYLSSEFGNQPLQLMDLILQRPKMIAVWGHQTLCF